MVCLSFQEPLKRATMLSFQQQLLIDLNLISVLEAMSSLISTTIIQSLLAFSVATASDIILLRTCAVIKRTAKETLSNIQKTILNSKRGMESSKLWESLWMVGSFMGLTKVTVQSGSPATQITAMGESLTANTHMSPLSFTLTQLDALALQHKPNMQLPVQPIQDSVH